MDAYIYQADLYCSECADAIKANVETAVNPCFDWEISDNYPQGPYPDGGGEADTPQHCGSCGKFLENPLTDAGREYVADLVEEFIDQHCHNQEHSMTGCLAQWIQFYGYEIKIIWQGWG